MAWEYLGHLNSNSEKISRSFAHGSDIQRYMST